MLELFQSLFGHEREEICYPEHFIRETIERTVDGTDPWFRGLSGYKRTLRPAVVKAVNYVADMIDHLADPLSLDPSRWGHCPELHAFFVGEDRLCHLLKSPSVQSALPKSTPNQDRLFGFLRMSLHTQTFMGVDKVKGVLTQGVAQTLVSFKGHQLVDLATDAGEVRRLVKQRAFDHLLRLALDRLALASGLRSELEQRATLLKAKMDLLKKGQWGLDLYGNDTPPCEDELSEQLEEIETLMAGVGDQTEYLENNLHIVADLLGAPEENLWMKNRSMIMDRDGILRHHATSDAPEFNITQAYNSEGWSMVVRLVEFPRLENA